MNDTAHHTNNRQISGQIVDVIAGTIYSGQVDIINGHLSAVRRTDAAPDQYILPGFIDAHIHIESSMLTPTGFGRLACAHGTVATVSDPHEIANVMGKAGVQYMIDDAEHSPVASPLMGMRPVCAAMTRQPMHRPVSPPIMNASTLTKRGRKSLWVCIS